MVFRTFLYLLLFNFLVSLSSCHKYKEENLEYLYGDWEHVHTREFMPAHNNDIPPDWIGGNSSVISFEKYGDFYSNGMEDTLGSFEVNGDDLMLFLGYREDKWTILKLSKNKLTLKNEFIETFLGTTVIHIYQYKKK